MCELTLSFTKGKYGFGTFYDQTQINPTDKKKSKRTNSNPTTNKDKTKTKSSNAKYREETNSNPTKSDNKTKTKSSKKATFTVTTNDD